MATEEIIEATNGAADDIKEAASDVQSDLAGVTEQVTQEVSRLAIALAQASFFAEFIKEDSPCMIWNVYLLCYTVD